MLISQNYHFKKPLTKEEKIALFQQASDARMKLFEKQEELDAQKDAFKAFKEEQEKIIDTCFTQFKSGYKIETIECQVTYQDKIATYTNVKTGEIVEEKPIDENEQLALNNGRIDAENIIREASRNE